MCFMTMTMAAAVDTIQGNEPSNEETLQTYLKPPQVSKQSTICLRVFSVCFSAMSSIGFGN